MGIAQGFTAGANAQLNREKLKQQKEVMALKLRQSGYTSNEQGGYDVTPGGAADVEQQARDVKSQEMAIQAEAMKSLQGRLAASSTDDAIVDFMDSGDANVFQKALDNDPFLKQAWQQKGVELITNVDWENDGKLLEEVGITQDFANNPEAKNALKKSIWKSYDGKQWKIGLLDQLVAETGALKRASTRRSGMIVDHMGKLRSAMSGVDVGLQQQKADTSQYLAETGRDQVEVNRLNAQTDGKRLDAAIDQDKKSHFIDLATLDYKDRKLAVDSKLGRGGTAKQKDMLASKQSTDKLMTTFGGREKFFETDFTNPDNYNDAYQHISAIERFEGIQLSSTEKKDLNNIRQLIALADPTSKLSSADTGIVDKFLGGVNKYLSDEVGGIQAKSAYAAFRNTVRHALFGSALTAPEIESFKEAFGALGQKLGPVLQQFKTNLTQVKAKLESIRRNGNPYVMKVRLGVDQEKLDNIISAFDKRIDYISGKTGKDSANYKPQVKKTKDERPSLDDLFNGTEGTK